MEESDLNKQGISEGEDEPWDVRLERQVWFHIYSNKYMLLCAHVCTYMYFYIYVHIKLFSLMSPEHLRMIPQEH